ncbi:MAG: chromosome segregation protein SMC [Bacillota bacterium]|nr:chromosome segregation protein SMC [Bacillota bacterium]
MYLKKLELFGFKSFAEKSELDLSPGIAAVIGPNGCGKSNLVDAVRWALGEQSVKSLRGSKMEEVIFSGSEKRKALNFAEVSLTFADAASFLNIEYDEVTITRRLFRSGDSEYYINKSPCRLKDITEMFMDTGLGKDIYSVIGQGRVEEIINSRPEERREIFEEAAGIFKYKLRKKEAGRRLDETRENLVRVQDLIFELETQIEPLQEQAEVTRRYRAIKEQIDTEEKKLLSYHLYNSREQLGKVNRQLQAVNDALLTAAARGGLYEKEVQDLKFKLQEEQRLKRELEQNMSKKSSTLEYQEGELRLQLERKSRFEEQIEQNNQRIGQLDILMDELSSQKVKAGEDLEEKKELLADLDIELEKLRAEMKDLESSALPGEVDRLREKIYLSGASKEAAKSTIEELKRRLGKINIQKETLKKDQAELNSILEKLENTKKEVILNIAKLNEERTAAEKYELEQLKEEEQIKLKLEKLGETASGKKEELHGLKSRLNLLEEQESALSGYYRGVKEIMQAGSTLSGIVGPVADLISVEDEHVQAIETALGGSLQYLVARNEKAVHEAIRYLKEGNRGWATFLPLDIIHRAANPLERFPGWNKLEGVIGRASDLVKFDQNYRKAIDYLMSTVIVCRDLKSASAAARFVEHSCRVVTLDGEMINPGGIMRGGSLPRRNAGMPLGRRKEIESLQREQRAKEKELETVLTDLEQLKKRLDECRQRLTGAAENKKRLSDLYAGVEKELNQLQSEIGLTESRLKASERANADLIAEEKEITGRLDELRKEIEKSTVDITELENRLSGTREQYKAYQEEKKILEQKITEVLVKISSYREQRDSLLERLENIDNSIQKPAIEKTEREKELERYKAELEKNREIQLNLKAELETITSEKARLIGKYEEKNRLVTELEAALVDLEEQGRRKQSQVGRQEKREKQLTVEQTRLQTEISYQEMRFRELFNTLDLVRTDENYDPEESQFTVENLKEDIEALGEVNLGAIEELARLEDRINFLTEQKDDLHRGEASLQKVLAEIDQRMEFYFKKSFEQINENFEQTFVELFEGGQVLLRLTDQDHILDSGIDIIAQPPGKKLQNINLLSAGEKVLTAIALVFAILRFKPAPFYLLDEVESMLDDANLTRFTKFLKQSSEDAQFILITHRKRTMEEAEVLYGVTMPEPGVSKLISLKLDHQVRAEGTR